MKTFCAYIHSNNRWYAWLYINDKVVKKLGDFNTKQEAIEAKEKYENETTTHSNGEG